MAAAEMASVDALPADPDCTIWLVDGNALDDDLLVRYVHRLGPSERQRHAGFVRKQRAREFLLGRLLLRHAACSDGRIAPDAVDVVERRGDAPLLRVNVRGQAAPYFSLSHAGGQVACALSWSVAVGVDIEPISLARRFDEVAAVAFDAHEQAWLMRQPAASRAADFYRLWTCKEALIKCLGRDRAAMASVIDAAGVFNPRSDEWQCVAPAHPHLAMALCCAAREVGMPRMVQMTSSAWLTASL